MIVTIQSTMKILIKSNEKNMAWLINGIVYNNDNELLLKLEAWLHFTKMMLIARNQALVVGFYRQTVQSRQRYLIGTDVKLLIGRRRERDRSCLRGLQNQCWQHPDSSSE